MLSNKVCSRVLLFLIATALSACGGGGGSGASSPPPPVSQAVISAQADIGVADLNQPVTLSVLANDSMSNGGKVVLSSVTVPANGTATISGDKIIYTPAAGFFGKDTFSYEVKEAGTGALTAAAAVAVNVSAKLTLTGRAVDVRPNAAVTIVVGSKTYTASTDFTGNYSAAVALDTPDSMISITAQGTGAGTFIKLISLVGDSKLAVAAAGTGSTLTPAQLPGLLVTSISTSLYANALLRNGGAVPANQQALEYATSGVSFAELMQPAVVLRSITGTATAGPTRTLPSGITDTLAFVTSRSVLRNYVSLLPVANIEYEYELLGNDLSLSSIPAMPVNVNKSLVLHANSTAGAHETYELVFNANGSGSLERAQQRSAGTWNASTMTLSLTTPEVRQDYAPLPDLSYIAADYRTTKVAMRRYAGTDTRALVSLTFSGTVTYPDGELPNGNFERTEVWAMDDWSIAVAPADISGAVLAGVTEQPFALTSPLGQIAVALNPDGSASSVQYPGKLGAWRVQDGKLSIDLVGIVQYPGMPPVNGNLTMGRVRTDADGTERWLARASYGGDYQVYESIIVRPQPGLAFDASNAAMNLTSGFGSNYVGTRTVYTIRADHTSSAERLEIDGVTRRLLTNTSWLIEGANLVMRTYRPAGSTGTLASCATGMTCTVYSERIWTLLKSDAKSVAVLESYKSTPTAPVRRNVLRLARN